MFSSISRNSVYRGIISILWFLILIGLPITSFPILSRLTGAIVAPFSAIPLAVLMLIWLLPYLFSRGKFPVEILPYLYFLLVALIVSALAFFLDGYYARGRDFFDQSLRAFITVGIGLGFYLIFAVFPQNVKIVRQTFVLIYVVGAVLVLWTLFEVALLREFYQVRNMPAWVIAIRSALSVQSPNIAYTSRVTGFAYEPSWFVRQFNLILFPIWLSAVFQRESIFKTRLWVFQVEDLLMSGGLIVFGFSSPRIGLLAFLASLAYLAVLLMRKLHRGITAWVLKRRKQAPKHMFFLKFALAVLMVLVMVALAVSSLTGYVVLASRWDNRYQLLLNDAVLQSLNIFPLSETRLIYTARQLAFFERMIFWFGGWNIFNDYPLGVGLGNAGFYLVDYMHGAGFESYEIRNLVYRANYLPNTKNLWTRLLAETGFIGLSIFLVWLYFLWRSAGLIRKSSSKVLRILGLAGQLFLLAYLVEGFSMDSFAMPYQWVMAGLISAGGVLVRHELVSTDKAPMSASV